MSAAYIPTLRRKPVAITLALSLLAALTFAMPVDAAGRHGIKKPGVGAAKAPAAKKKPAAKKGQPASKLTQKAKRRAKARPAARQPATKSPRPAPTISSAALIATDIALPAAAAPRGARQACLREGRIFLLADCQDSAQAAVMTASSASASSD